MFFLAAFRVVLIAAMSAQIFFLATAAGMIGSPFGRTTADGAILRTLASDCMGDRREAQGQWSQGTRNDQRVHH
jgi:hypothetical protein